MASGSGELFVDLGEFIEVELAESLVSRTESLPSFRELGPPDLVHVIKTSGRSGSKDLGSYHFCSGIDASSSASLAAYLNALGYAFEPQSTWLGGKAKSEWKIRSGCYCCFNAFSRVDVRVEVKIPGGVDAYIIDLRGERHDMTPRLWTEVYLSAILRAIHYADDPSYRLAGYRKLDPIRTIEDEQRFLAAAEQCFPQAWQLGSDAEIQVATSTSNHLASGLMKYFGDAFRFGAAVNLFEKLVVQDEEVSSLLARSYLGMNEEVKAVQILHQALQDMPQSYTLLHVQADFLRSKGRTDWAHKLAKAAVNCAPSEFVTWSKLTECNMELQRWTEALLTLNSCPMFTVNERDLHRMPTPARTHLPVKQFIVESEILDDDRDNNNEADIALLRLPAPSLRGTFAKAYVLLTKLVSLVGWDELLKCRSLVFVMEEEYRLQKQQTSPQRSSVAINGASHVEHDGDEANGADDSIRPGDQADENASVKGMAPPGSPIPVIKISTESDGERERLKDAGVLPQQPDIAKPQQSAEASTNHAVEEPEEVAPESFSNKRLCERWLDNLFMVLYEDLRVYTIWRAEVAHFKAQHMPYRKTGTEWEILGDLAARLHHKEEAKEAYQRCLDLKFSAKAWLKLLEFYADEGDVQRALNAATRLAVYQARWYQESSYPSAVAHELFKLIRKEGVSKISYSLVSMNLPQPILKLMQGMFTYAQAFGSEGATL